MKNLFKLTMLVALAALVPSMAFGWNCSDPLAEREPVATGTTGTFGDGDGQLFLGTGGEGKAGQLYQCNVVPPGTTPPTGTINTHATATSTSSSSSNSTSGATATGGSATANGGSSSSKSGVSNSGNSSVGPINTTSSAAGGKVSNSGNSSNTNTNTAQGGAGGQGGQGGAGGSSNQTQTQSSTSSATNNGNGSNNASYSSTTNIAAPKIPVATAYAPNVYPTATCFKGISAGVQTVPVGFSFGGGKIDENCAILEAARAAKNRLAFCKVYVSNKYVSRAGVTLVDCLLDPQPPAVLETAPVVVPEPVAPQPIIIYVQPTPPVVIPAPEVTVAVPQVVEKLRPVGPIKKRVRKPCPANKESKGVFEDDSFKPYPAPVVAVCEQ
jgi:hypothetical protein